MKGSALFGWAFVMLLAATAEAQVVQLPTFHQFGVSTTVMVPDSGGVTAADLYFAREAAITRGFGPLRNRGFAREFGTSSVGTSARIMDRREMDEHVLRMAGGDRLPADAAAADRAARLAGAVARTSGKGPLSVTELRREREAKDQAERAKVVRYIEQGDSFREQGKLTTARAFYRMAWQRTTDEALRSELKDRLAQLERR